MEEERERGLAAANETAALVRPRPLSLRDKLEKDGCLPIEKLRMDMFVMMPVDMDTE